MRRKGFTPLEIKIPKWERRGFPERHGETDVRQRHRSFLTGFTLIELLVVISVISLLMAVLMPALARARRQGKSVACLNNLRQMVIAAAMYVDNNDGYYPLTQDISIEQDDKIYEYVWDFVTITDKADDSKQLEPGILWEGQGVVAIQQCPAFKGSDNWGGEQYTGYNYNASYIGGSRRRDPWSGRDFFMPSAKVSQVKRPGQCAIFGDGEYSNGANKFMRSPFAGSLDGDFSASARYAGTQGYRHLGATNAAYCDGSAEGVRELYTETDKWGKGKIAEGTGFLSPDNSAYDLE